MMQLSSFDNCVCHYNIEILNVFDSELQQIKPLSKLKRTYWIS